MQSGQSTVAWRIHSSTRSCTRCTFGADTFKMTSAVRFDLCSGATPTVDVTLQGTQMFIPFRHRADLYTRSESHPFWSFDDMDEDEFPPDARRVHASDWILCLDPGYAHGTTIRCTHGGVHGLNMTIHTKKGYRGMRRSHYLQAFFPVTQASADALHKSVVGDMELIESRWPMCVSREAEARIIPAGIVSEYVMRRCTYSHAPNMDMARAGASNRQTSR